MEKKRKVNWILVGIVTVIILGFWLIHYTEVQSRPFKYPENLAQKVANKIYINPAKTTNFNVGTKDKGTTYSKKLVAGKNVYVIEISIRKNGKKNLSIDHYWTNRNFDELKTAADFIIYEFQYGRPGIYIETHFTDYDIDMKVDLKQEFKKPWDKHSLVDFSREERDGGEEAGMKEFSVDHGQIFKDGQWTDAPEEQKAAQEDYEYILEEAAKLPGVR